MGRGRGAGVFECRFGEDGMGAGIGRMELGVRSRLKLSYSPVPIGSQWGWFRGA